jgi:hypothetical protein
VSSSTTGRTRPWTTFRSRRNTFAIAPTGSARRSDSATGLLSLLGLWRRVIVHEQGSDRTAARDTCGGPRSARASRPMPARTRERPCSVRPRRSARVQSPEPRLELAPGGPLHRDDPAGAEILGEEGRYRRNHSPLFPCGPPETSPAGLRAEIVMSSTSASM